MNLLNKFLSKTEPDHLEFAPPLLRLQESAPNPLGRKVLWAIHGSENLSFLSVGKPRVFS